MENRKLEPGEQYLTIVLAGHNSICAFKNKTKEGNQPDYRADGIAVWINKKKGEKSETVEEIKIN